MGHREQLLDAAKRLLSERGYADITARDLVAASDTNLGSIGYHFGSKEALLNQAVHALLVEWSDQIDAVALAAEDAAPLDRLGLTFTTWTETFSEHRHLALAMIEAITRSARSEPLRAVLAEGYRESRERIAASVDAALGEDAAARGVNTQLVAAFIMAVCDGLLLQHLLDPESAPSGAELVEGLGAALALALERAGVAPPE